MKKIRAIIGIIGISVLFWNLLFVTRAFILAYLNPEKTYTLNINNYNEALPELIFILVLLPFGLFVALDTFIGIYRVLRQIK